MRRIKLVLGALAVVVAMLAAFAGPAMADNLNNCRNVSGPGIRCDGTRFLPVNDFNNGFTLFNSGFNSPFGFGFPGFDAFDNINGFDGFNNDFDGGSNGVFQSVG
jgi:hypothetical protein